jgi:hypothetical protein
MTIYFVELYKAGEYETSKVAFIIDSIGPTSAINAARATGEYSHLNASRKVQMTNKKAAQEVVNGAKDLR